ncbi:hypothetical protein [Oceanobacillus neutriphilus]|uniref:Uncharacterized protein n=1 Tax=Oceanobacillus neutriphilus TaxID=531815 RepID=A0ABQ2P3T2_9BACI|nr:hypothetical protein [Oceanobacillus neutriphilus]GGP17265.1 hypothetical protein GCM10011346_52440 [Oceanobacillus neutriphilus]
MNLDQAIELSKKVREAYDEGYLDLNASTLRLEIHLNNEKFNELSEGREVFIGGFSKITNERYFKYEGYKFFNLVERNGDSNE